MNTIVYSIVKAQHLENNAGASHHCSALAWHTIQQVTEVFTKLHSQHQCRLPGKLVNFSLLKNNHTMCDFEACRPIK